MRPKVLMACGLKNVMNYAFDSHNIHNISLIKENYISIDSVRVTLQDRISKNHNA